LLIRDEANVKLSDARAHAISGLEYLLPDLFINKENDKRKDEIFSKRIYDLDRIYDQLNVLKTFFISKLPDEGDESTELKRNW
jgi:hypothetical protein